MNGKPRAIVLPIGNNLEETLSIVRKARASAALEKIRNSSREKGLENLSVQEIDT
ncbi:MAG: hypothetical protein Q7V05_02940 [Methanoregula sp.]|nr:hypothetical protein [Methanoregula sp.]